jgi:hypothetical protein
MLNLNQHYEKTEFADLYVCFISFKHVHFKQDCKACSGNKICCFFDYPSCTESIKLNLHFPFSSFVVINTAGESPFSRLIHHNSSCQAPYGRFKHLPLIAYQYRYILGSFWDHSLQQFYVLKIEFLSLLAGVRDVAHFHCLPSTDSIKQNLQLS